MKTAISLGLILLGANASAAEFSKSIFLKGYYNPDASHIAELTEFCSAETAKIESRIKAVAEKNSIDLKTLKVEPSVHYRNSETTGDACLCSARISGLADKNLKWVTLGERINHLRTKGFKKGDFGSACDDIAHAYSLNSNEIYQRKTVSFALINGNNCFVQSTVLVAKP